MKPQKIERCEVCGTTDVFGTIVCSAFGAHSFACCEACLAVDKEPYGAIVSYISGAGHWPQDINKMYQYEVRRQLKLHNKTEEEFRNDVEFAIAEEQVTMIDYYKARIDF